MSTGRCDRITKVSRRSKHGNMAGNIAEAAQISEEVLRAQLLDRYTGKFFTFCEDYNVPWMRSSKASKQPTPCCVG